MLETFGDRQQALLRTLHQHKAGFTADELAARLGVSRPAVKQHLTGLEQSGFVAKGGLRLTKGRPGRVYRLTGRGIELFPKQYSWFSSLLLEAIRKERGSQGLARYLRDLAATVAKQLEPRVAPLAGPARAAEVVKIMNELSYDAEATPDGAQAHNCVYHALAAEYPEVCQFDLELLERLTNSQVDHQECMIRGGGVCRFALRPK